MRALRLPRRGRSPAPGLGSLVVLLVFLGLVLAPIGGSLAGTSQDDPANEQAQGDGDPTETPVEKTEEPIPPTQIPTGSPPTEPAVTEPVATETATEAPVATETAVDDPPPNDMPGIASTTTLVMVSGTCDVAIGTWPAGATSLADLQAACNEYVIDNTFTYTYLDTGGTQTHVTTGGTTSFVVDPGAFRVETVYPPGMRNAAVGCESTNGYSYVRPVFRGFPPNDVGFSSHIDLGDTLTCYWYNLPLQPTIINLIKGECDVVGFDPYTASADELAKACTQQAGEATFTYMELFTGDPASELEITQTTVASQTSFAVIPGNFGIQEDIPAGYGNPVVSCLIERWGVHVIFPAPGGLIGGHIDSEGIVTCHWYNVPLGQDSDLIMHTRVCPPGYDPAAPNADPLEDCPESLDGVVFEAEDANGFAAAATTGDSSPGTAVFANLESGAYTINEILPAGYTSAFIWTCTTANTPDAATAPIAIGTTLTVTMVAGWDTTCFWFNVAEVPATGSITVVKYTCPPANGWSLPRCTILETGQAFDLLYLTGTDWQPAGTGITGRDGRLTWTDLPPGTYLIDEVGRDWCRIESFNLEPGGKGITVNPGEDVVVHVYNCARPATPGPIPFPKPPPLIPAPREW